MAQGAAGATAPQMCVKRWLNTFIYTVQYLPRGDVIKEPFHKLRVLQCALTYTQ